MEILGGTEKSRNLCLLRKDFRLLDEKTPVCSPFRGFPLPMPMGISYSEYNQVDSRLCWVLHSQLLHMSTLKKNTGTLYLLLHNFSLFEKIIGLCMESLQSQFLGETSSSFKLGVCWYPCDGDIGFALGLFQFCIRNVWPCKSLLYLKVPKENAWVGQATGQRWISPPIWYKRKGRSIFPSWI